MRTVLAVSAELKDICVALIGMSVVGSGSMPTGLCASLAVSIIESFCESLYGPFSMVPRAG